MPRTAYLFPGQGAQDPAATNAVLHDAPDLLALAIELVGENPIPRCADSTRFAQPAIVLAGLAAWRRIGRPTGAIAFAGHSLGELSALAAAGALPEADALRLAVVRGELMARAEERSDGSMLAVLKGALADAAALALAHELTVANDNAPGQVVLAGPSAAVEAARRAAPGHGLRAIELDVSGAFHTTAMAPAVDEFAQALDEADWRPPSAVVLSGLTARPFADVKAELATAIVRPVRWREVMLALDELGTERYVDIGPGTVLQMLVTRNLPERADVVSTCA